MPIKNYAPVLVLLAVLALLGCQAAGPATPTKPAPQTAPAQTPALQTPAVQTPANRPVAEQVVQSNKPRAAAQEPNQDVSQLTAGNTAFAFDLYKRLVRADGNLFFSPYSISLALAMTYAGARGGTEQEMATTLHYYLGQDRLDPAFNSLDQALAKRGQEAKGKDSQPFRLKIANAIWGQAGYAFRPDFLDVLAQNYGAGLRLLNFGSPEPARQTINQWVSDQTEGRIKDLLAPGSVTPDSRLVLTNAIYFNAAWMEQFDKNATQDDKFRLIDGEKTVEVPMMVHAAHYDYAAGDSYQAIDLPYDGNEISMLVLVPDLGKFKQVEASLSPDLLATVQKQLKNQQVILNLPRWKFDSSFALGDPLKQMGMQDSFVYGKADFSGMDGTHDLFISDVVHKAFVAVDEAGTEAAAATAVIVAAGAAPAEPVKLTVDRPFVFFILDRQTGTVLFVGRVLNPA